MTTHPGDDAPPPKGQPFDPGPPNGPPVLGLAAPSVHSIQEAVVGVRYHRLVVGPGAWWRLPVAVVVGAVGLVLGPLLAVLVVLLGARALGHDDFSFALDDGLTAAEMLGINLGLALLIPVAAGGYWMLYRRRPRWLGSIRPGLRRGWLGRCAAMALKVWALLMVLATVGAAVQRTKPVDSAVVWFLIVVLLTTPLQAAGEEYLFRGLLLQSLGATRMPTWICCVVSAAVFATAHAQFDPPLFADRFVIGLVFAGLAIKTGGLEAGIAIHTVKNLAGLIPAALLDDVSDTLDPQAVSWLPVAVDVVLLAILVPWMLAVTRKRVSQGRLQTVYAGAGQAGDAAPS